MLSMDFGFTPTPLHVIETRLMRDDFHTEVTIVLDRDGTQQTETLYVHFPPEWPGAAIALLPHWKARLEADPEYELLGGTMIDCTQKVAVGQMTFRRLPLEPDAVELGYGVNPSYEGLGYATEMARALVHWARERPDIKRITSAFLDSNFASIRVLEKVGFTRVGDRIDDEGRSILWEY